MACICVMVVFVLARSTENCCAVSFRLAMSVSLVPTRVVSASMSTLNCSAVKSKSERSCDMSVSRPLTDCPPMVAEDERLTAPVVRFQ